MSGRLGGALPLSARPLQVLHPQPTPHPRLALLSVPGADCVPFAEMPALRDAILTSSDLEAGQMQGVSGHPGSHPRSLASPGPNSLQPDPSSDPHT